MLSAAYFCKQRVSIPRASARLSLRSRRLEAVFRSPKTTVRFRAAIMRSLFPTGADQTRCLFNASLDFPQVRLAPGSPLEPAAPASASQRRLPDLTSVPDPGLASGLRCTFGVSAPPCGNRRSGQTRFEQHHGTWIPAFPPICDRKARLPKQPDFRCSSTGRYAAGGSSLRIRYCFGGSTFLKPLGTDSILPRPA